MISLRILKKLLSLLVVLALLSAMMPLAWATPGAYYTGTRGPIWMNTERGPRPTFLPSGWSYEDPDYPAVDSYPIDATLVVQADDTTYRLRAEQLELSLLGQYPDNYDYYGYDYYDCYDRWYDRCGRYQRYVYRYELSAASKIALVARQCQKICSLPSEIARAENYMPVTMTTLQSYIDSQQIAPIWQHLTMRDAEYITSRQLSAEQALRYIQTTEQYRTTPDLQKYTDYCLNEMMSGGELRDLLSELDPRNAKFYRTCSVQSLLQNARLINDWRTVRDLRSTIERLGGNDTSLYWLKQRFTARQLSDYCNDLLSLASAYYPGYVNALNQAVFMTTY